MLRFLEMRPFAWPFTMSAWRHLLIAGLCVGLCVTVTACIGASNPSNSSNPSVSDSSVPTPIDALAVGAPGLGLPPVIALNIPGVAPLAPGVTVTITAIADGRWDTIGTWGGRLPTSGDVVSIPRGRTVELVGKTANLGGVWLDGTLNFADADIDFSSRYVVVSGRWQAGSESKPYSRRAQITLFGSDETQSVMGMGTKFIGVVNGGLLKWHGEQRLSWTQLTANAGVGATSVSLKDDAGSWRAGDRIVLAPSGFDPREAEVVTVSKVTGSSVTFAPALKFARVAHLETIEGRVLDERPSVGLLSRNIVVRGAADSEANAFGGHVMVMAGGNAQVSGIELVKMGQRGRFGRYPFHWHLAGVRNGNYLIGSAIHDSFQRAVVVHSSSNVMIDGNVADNIPNHAFVWAEDGDESAVTMTRNLALRVRSPEEKYFAFPINNAFFANSSQGEQRSAAFWGRSYNRHVIRGNVSAGVLDGFGFFFDRFTPAPKGSDEGSGLVFENNTAYATYKEMAIGNQINYPEATRGHGLMVSTGSSGKTEHVFKNFTGYHNTNGAWLEDRSTRLKDGILADNGLGLIVHRGVIDGPVIVGKSASSVLRPQATASIEFNEPGAINVGGSNHGGKRSPLIVNATVVNQQGAGVVWDVDNISPASAIGNIKFVNTATRLRVHSPSKFEFPNGPNFGLNDPNGKVLGDGLPVRWMMSDSNLIDAICKQHLNVRAFACPIASSLLLESDTKSTLVGDDGKIAYLEPFNYGDASMPAEGAVSLVANNGRYEVLGAASSRRQFKLTATAGQSLELSFAALSVPSRVALGGQNLMAVASLAALRVGGSGFFFDATGKMLHVRAVTGAGAQSLVLEGSFTAGGTPGNGLVAVALPVGNVAGFRASTAPGTAQYQIRYGLPAAGSSLAFNAGLIDGTASDAAVSGSGPGVTTVVRGYINAPVDGLYRLALWGSGGGTSLYVGNTWVMGEPWAFINSNFVKGGQLETEVVPYFHPNGMVALKAGWHAFSAVHAKMPENQEGNTLHLRWATPQNPDLWVYPQVRRTP